MKFCELYVKTNVFQDDNKLCKQITRIPMGSPVSVDIAELTLQNILNDNTNDVLLWKKCADGCLAIMMTSEMDNLFGYINNINNNIQLTVKKEVKVDIIICKQNNGSLSFKVFRK